MKQGKHLILIGLPGSGKSTVGKALAPLLGLPLIDLDQVLEAHFSQDIPGVFARRGEAVFRRQESRLLRQALGAPSSIISTGGGVILQEENRRLLSENGFVIFLDRSPAEIAKNLSLSTHPTLQNMTLEEMSRIRRPLYLSCADASVCQANVQETAAQCAALWRLQQ